MSLENLIPLAEDFGEIVKIISHIYKLLLFFGKRSDQIVCQLNNPIYFSPPTEVFAFLLLFRLPPHCYSDSSVTHNPTLPQITETSVH